MGKITCPCGCGTRLPRRVQGAGAAYERLLGIEITARHLGECFAGYNTLFDGVDVVGEDPALMIESSLRSIERIRAHLLTHLHGHAARANAPSLLQLHRFIGGIDESIAVLRAYNETDVPERVTALIEAGYELSRP